MHACKIQCLIAFTQQTSGSVSLAKNLLARHRRCDVYCGARETVGGSSVSSGCWGEDSHHEYGWARRTPTYVAPIRFSSKSPDPIEQKQQESLGKSPVLLWRRLIFVPYLLAHASSENFPTPPTATK